MLMKKALNNPVFGKQIDRVSVTYVPDFCWTATFLLMQLQENLVSFVVDADSETSELFLHG